MTQTSTRRTVHNSYADLDPTEYSYVTAFDSAPEPGQFMGDRSEYEMDDGTVVEANNAYHAEYLWATRLLGSSFTSKWAGSGQCDHCGARLRYVVVLKHGPTDSHMAVGETCHAERFEHDSKLAKDLDRLHKRAAAVRALAKVRAAVTAWTEADPQNLEAVEYAEANQEGNDFYTDLLRKLRQYGPWSDRQRDAVLRGKASAPARALAAAAREAEVKVPVVEGRQMIVGEVIKTEEKENDYGWRTVMTVKDDRGFLVWGTMPSGLDAEKGDRVKFAGTVTKSDRDESFGFFKRPAKAERVGVTA